MIHLHEIKSEDSIFTDMICAQIWTMRTNPDYGWNEVPLRINLNKSLEIFDQQFGMSSPISYFEEDYNEWTNWYWETRRLSEWVAAGRPAIDTSNIEIGRW